MLNELESSDGALPVAGLRTMMSALPNAAVDGIVATNSVAELAVVDSALYFFTGPAEQKARNLAGNPRCALLTGCNVIDGLDVVVEGEAVRVRNEAKLQGVADAVATKYADGAGLGDDWRFAVRDGAFAGPGGNEAHLFELLPSRGYAFGKGAAFSHTRFRF